MQKVNKITPTQVLSELIKLPSCTKDPEIVSVNGGPSYQFDRSTMYIFWDVYQDAIDNGVKMYLAQKQRVYSNLIFDVDISKIALYPGEVRELYTIEDVESLLGHIYKVLREGLTIYKWRKPISNIEPYLKCVLLQKRQAIDPKNGKVKHGYHLHFPYLQLHTNARIFIRKQVEKLSGVKLDAIENNHWLLYGSRKSDITFPYVQTRMYHGNNADWTISDLKAIDFCLFDVDGIMGSSSKVETGTFNIPCENVPKSIEQKPLEDVCDINTDHVQEYLDSNDLTEYYDIKGDKLIRKSPGSCVVNTNIEHDRDNGYILVKNNHTYVGCFRGCKFGRSKLRPIA